MLPFRDLFPTRIALRLNEAGQVDLVLGDGARNRGALCDQIPDWAEGVGYVVLDHHPEPTRVRFCYVNDDDIRDAGRRLPGAPADAADIPPRSAPDHRNRPAGATSTGRTSRPRRCCPTRCSTSSTPTGADRDDRPTNPLAASTGCVPPPNPRSP